MNDSESTKALKVHFEFDTKAYIWLPPCSGAKHIQNEIVIPAKSIVLVDSGGLSFQPTLILDVRVPMERGFEGVSIHVPWPNLGNINFLPKEQTDSGYKRFDLDGLVYSLVNG